MRGHTIQINFQVRSRCLAAILFGCAFVAALSGRAQTLAEALDTTNLVWTTGGDAPWFAQTTNTYDGVDAVRSGIVGSNQTSWIETTVIGPATVNLWEQMPWVSFSYSLYHSFTINGDAPTGIIEVYPCGLSGCRWGDYSYDLSEGANVLRWSVTDYYGAGTQAFATVDQLELAPPRPLSIVHQPASCEVLPGEWISLSIWAIGTPPLRYQWLRDGTNVLGATNNWLYYFKQATTNDAGVYSVVVSNSQGFVISSNAVLTIQPPAAPFFVFEPASVTGYTGQTLTFSAWVDGSPPFTYQWRKGGTNLPGATGDSLTMTNLTQADAGNYSLVVSNQVGSVQSSNAVLTVILSVPPIITRQPRSLEVAEGVCTWLSIELGAVFDPIAGWHGKWTRRPWTSLPGTGYDNETIRALFGSITTNDAGVYFASVRNYGGAVESRDALLTVLPPMANRSSWWQGAADIFVTNGLAFLAQGSSGLAILDVSNPGSPVMLGGYNTPGDALAVQVSGGLAFVADGSAGLQILSVTNPSNPIRLGSYDTPGKAQDVFVRSNLAFVADGSAGLLILKVENPALPSLVGGFSTNLNAKSVCLGSNFLCIGSSSSSPGICLLDISDPALPVELGRVPTSWYALAARDTSVFVASRDGLKVYDVRDPARPILAGSFSDNSCYRSVSVFDVQVLGDLAYAVVANGGSTSLLVLDVRDPRDLVPVGYHALPAGSSRVCVDGNLVCVAGESSPLQIIETPFDTRPVAPPLLSLSAQAGLKLQLHGRRGLYYDLEYADSLDGSPWQPLPTFLLTNETAVLELPAPSGTRFFRTRQVD